MYIKHNKLKNLNLNKLDFLFKNKITFVYLILNLCLFNNTKSFFTYLSYMNISMCTKKNNKFKFFSSRCIFVNSDKLEFLFEFNSFFTNNFSLGILGVYYFNMYFSFNYFKNLILTSNLYLKKIINLLIFNSCLKLFYIFRRQIIKNFKQCQQKIN